ncbi:hypothetical protein QT987_00855 [Microcoleus sp. SVA1B4]
MSRKLCYPPGNFNAKLQQETVLGESTGLYENTLSQPLNKVKKPGCFGLECLSDDCFSAKLICTANQAISFDNKM